MTIAEMLEQAGLLTVLGMAVVFAFLWFMIICVNLTAKLVHRMGWDTDIQASGDVPVPPAHSGGAVPPETAAAITAAVTAYRERGTERPV